MSNKLAKRDIPVWGENLSAFLEICRREGDEELIQKVEEKLVAGYLLGMRRELEENPQARQIAAEAEPATEAWGPLSDKLWHLVKPGSEDLFERALHIILQELDAARQAPPSFYLISSDTGRAIMPLSKKDIFQPPDYVGEDGIQRPAKPIIHPAITSSLALLTQEGARSKALQRGLQDPEKRAALAHLAGPSGIVQSAKDRLAAVGVKIMDLPEDVPAMEVEFGREQVDGISQAPNYHFHRAGMFSAILAQKVLKLCGGAGQCHMGEAKEMKNSRQRWYVIPVRVQPARQLPPGSEVEPVSPLEQN